MIIEKQVSELIVGHYIVDIKQQESKLKLASPNHIKSGAVINNLKHKGVISVLIDDEKTAYAESETPKEAIVKEAPSQLSSNEVTPEKLLIAKEIFNESKAIQKKVFNDAKDGSELDLEPICEVTNKSVDAIFDSPDSLACIVNIRHKDEYLLEHSISVSIYLTIFACYLNINKATTQEMALGAFLHDVGKIMVPDEILNKPAKLTDAEFYIMKTHANHTIDIFEKTQGISRLSYEIAAYHHEKLDGTGYPLQLKADKINKYCRMMNICDIFDALTANRCYKDSFSRSKAFSILRSLAKDNFHLDSELVEHFIDAIGAYPIGSLVLLKSNKIAIVERKNTVVPLLPGVRSFYNCDKNEFLKSEEIDLSISEDVIVKGVRASDFNLDMEEVIESLIKQT